MNCEEKLKLDNKVISLEELMESFYHIENDFVFNIGFSLPFEFNRGSIFFKKRRNIKSKLIKKAIHKAVYQKDSAINLSSTSVEFSNDSNVSFFDIFVEMVNQYNQHHEEKIDILEVFKNKL